MDDLFKRAAENYPLKTDGADWNAVAKKLAEPEEDKPAASGRYKHLFWLLLLLPLGGIYFYMSGKNEKPVNTANEIIVKQNNKDANAQGNNSPENIVEETSQQAPVSKKITPDVSNVKPAIRLNNSLVLVKPNRLQGQGRGRLNAIITSAGNITVSSDKQSEVTDQKTELATNTITADIAGTNKKDIANNNTDENTINNLSDPKRDDIKQDSDNKNTVEKKTTSLQKKNPKQKERGLYAGIVVGPDISTVKFQPVKNIGVSMGVLVGYQINTKISVESGISWDIKNYYSKGEYFNKSIVYPNPNTKIKSVEGVCNMIEVPVMVRYNLAGDKSNVSISGGVSSYIMKKEDYDYVIIYNNGQPYPHSSSYKNSSTDLLAVANFSVGYNRQVKKGVALRIEPYIKIPVKGVGMGSLPIMSTGLHAGITKKILR
ncbi:MAG TPA: hypothetical protein VMY77_16710 [Chitinophagaceae bacterium]|nr:hypothetical protein [Chitinophagaceae bacterium]